MSVSVRTCTLHSSITLSNKKPLCAPPPRVLIPSESVWSAQGNNDSYDMLVDQFNIKKTSYDAPSPTPQLRLWLQALMHVVSRLDRTHMALIEAILRLPWMIMDSSLVKTYTSFIQILVSARPEYLSLVLSRIARGFTYRASS